MILLLSSLALAGSLGSYGRVGVTTDPAGGAAEDLNVVEAGTRLFAPPYLELDLKWESPLADDHGVDVVLTPAFAGDPFAYTGEWTSALALRNAFVQTHAPGGSGLWAGARMVRGDDIYLLDLWPMDALNLVGGGAALGDGDWLGELHVGLNRLERDDWQVQRSTVVVPGAVETREVLTLDRQRQIAALRLGHTTSLRWGTLRPRIYVEGHRLPAGERRVEADLSEALPSDWGLRVGSQLTVATGKRRWAHLWLTQGRRLAAWDELATPEGGLALDGTTRGARTTTLAGAGLYEGDRAGLLVGGSAQKRVDGDGMDDLDDSTELIVSARPAIYPAPHLMLAAELSHQWRQSRGLDPRSGRVEAPAVTQLALLPTWQKGQGLLSRPAITAQYVLSIQNNSARLSYDEADPRYQQNIQHQVGIVAEWWIESRYDAGGEE